MVTRFIDGIEDPEFRAHVLACQERLLESFNDSHVARAMRDALHGDLHTLHEDAEIYDVKPECLIAGYAWISAQLKILVYEWHEDCRDG